MYVISGDVWSFHKDGNVIGVTTNGIIRSDGRAVMGAGIALQAANKFPFLPKLLADMLGQHGNRVFFFPSFNILTFPTKHHWKDNSDLLLIETSAKQLAALLAMPQYTFSVYMTPPGCGHGKLSWRDVEPILNRALGAYRDRVTIVTR